MQAFIISRITYVAPFLALKKTEQDKINCIIFYSIYADDATLWCCAAKRHYSRAREVTQQALNGLVRRLSRLGLRVAREKTAVLAYHPTARTARETPPIIIDGEPLEWQQKVRYLGLLIDKRLTWLPEVRRIRAKLVAVQNAVRALAAKGNGCTQEWALRLYDAVGMSHLLYTLPIITLNLSNRAKLERDHTAAVRMCLGLPSRTPIAATLTETGASPAKLRVERTGLNYRIFAILSTPFFSRSRYSK